MEFWKISDFAKAIGKHTNTVDGWFKQLEEKNLHYVNRTEYGEKVYDQLDMEIASFIKERRDQKWTLDGIFNELPSHFELRLMPDEEATSVPQIYDPYLIRKEFEEVAKQIAASQAIEMNMRLQELAAAQIQEIKQQYEDLVKRLPQPKSIEDERQERITEMMTRRRVESELEKEALNMWATIPEEERKIRVGFFRKEEDRDKRDQFIKNYVNQRFESRIRKEYELE
jgi:hypothetical protein